MIMPHSLHGLVRFVPLPMLRVILPLYGQACSRIYPHLARREFAANEIVQGVYLGSVFDAFCIDGLKKRNVTHVLTAVVGLEEMYPGEFEYLNLPVMDVPGEDMTPYLHEAADFVQKGIDSGGNVLVHCMRGRSRSATCVAAHLIRDCGMNTSQSVNLMKDKRPIAQPNTGFMGQLRSFEKNVGGTQA